MFPASLEKVGPKHSMSVSFSAEFAVPLSDDVKEVALVPKPVPVPTVKGLPTPHGPGALAVLCTKEHSLLPFTLQMVIPFLSPVTVHLKVNLSSGQVGGGAVNCPVTWPWRDQTLHTAYTVDMILSCSKVTKLLSHSSAFFLSTTHAGSPNSRLCCMPWQISGSGVCCLLRLTPWWWIISLVYL